MGRSDEVFVDSTRRGDPPGGKRIAIGDPKVRTTTTLTPPAGEQMKAYACEMEDIACRAFFCPGLIWLEKETTPPPCAIALAAPIPLIGLVDVD
jgi:hypothetical protein